MLVLIDTILVIKFIMDRFCSICRRDYEDDDGTTWTQDFVWRCSHDERRVGREEYEGRDREYEGRRKTRCDFDCCNACMEKYTVHNQHYQLQ